MPRLETLNLRCNELGEETCQSLFDLVTQGQSSSLTGLDLSYNESAPPLNAAYAVAVAAAAAHHPSEAGYDEGGITDYSTQ